MNKVFIFFSSSAVILTLVIFHLTQIQFLLKEEKNILRQQGMEIILSDDFLKQCAIQKFTCGETIDLMPISDYQKHYLHMEEDGYALYAKNNKLVKWHVVNFEINLNFNQDNVFMWGIFHGKNPEERRFLIDRHQFQDRWLNAMLSFSILGISAHSFWNLMGMLLVLIHHYKLTVRKLLNK